MDTHKLSAEQLVRQLKVLGAVIDEDVKFTKDELLGALETHLKNKFVKEVKLTKELLEQKVESGETLAEIGFKKNDVVLVLDSEKNEPKKKKITHSYGPAGKAVLSVEKLENGTTRIKLAEDNAVILLSAEQVEKDLHAL